MQKAFKALRARVLIVRYLEFQGYMSARPTRQRLTWGMYIATAFLIAAALFVCIFYGMSVVRVVCGWVCPALTLHVVPPGLCFLPEQALAWLRCFGIAVLIDILVLQPMKAMGFYLFWRVSQGEDPNAAKRDAEHAKLLDVTNFSHRDNPANGGGDGDGSGAQCRLYTSPPRCLDVHHVTRHHVALTWEAPDHIAVDRTCVPVVGCLWCWVGTLPQGLFGSPCGTTCGCTGTQYHWIPCAIRRRGWQHRRCGHAVRRHGVRAGQWTGNASVAAIPTWHDAQAHYGSCHG